MGFLDVATLPFTGGLGIASMTSGSGGLSKEFDPGGWFGGPKPGGPMAPDVLGQQRQAYIDQLKSQQSQSEQMASDFQKQMPGMQQEATSAIGDSQRKQAANQITGIRQNASTRGLLYSGKRQTAEAYAGTIAQQNIASQAAQIADQLQSQNQQLQTNAAQAGLDTQAAQAGIYRQNYNAQLQDALSKRQSFNSMLGGLLGAGGQVAGQAAGQQGGQSQQSSSLVGQPSQKVTGGPGGDMGEGYGNYA